MAKLHAYLMDIYRSVDTSMRLEKVAEYYANDETVKAAALKAKVAIDAEVFALAKRASLKSELAQKALGGLAYSAAPVAGAGLVGYSLLNKAKHDAEDATSDVRNKVLQTALGLGGIGAGLYGLNQLTDGHKKESAEKKKVNYLSVAERKRSGVSLDQLKALSRKFPGQVTFAHEPSSGNALQKQSADHEAIISELVEKLAAVGKIEDNFEFLDIEALSPEAQKLAYELRAINQRYGVQLLHEASHLGDK